MDEKNEKRDLLKAESLQDVAAEVQRPELVALGPVVITFLHRPQRRHKGLEHGMAFR